MVTPLLSKRQKCDPLRILLSFCRLREGQCQLSFFHLKLNKRHFFKQSTLIFYFLTMFKPESNRTCSIPNDTHRTRQSHLKNSQILPSLFQKMITIKHWIESLLIKTADVEWRTWQHTRLQCERTWVRSFTQTQDGVSEPPTSLLC